MKLPRRLKAVACIFLAKAGITFSVPVIVHLRHYDVQTRSIWRIVYWSLLYGWIAVGLVRLNEMSRRVARVVLCLTSIASGFAPIIFMLAPMAIPPFERIFYSVLCLGYLVLNIWQYDVLSRGQTVHLFRREQ